MNREQSRRPRSVLVNNLYNSLTKKQLNSTAVTTFD